MSEQPLQRVEIDARFQHVGREGMTKKMNSTGLSNLSAALGRREGVLERGGAEMAASIPRREEVLARLIATEVLPKLFE